jgi:hypothetical protein
MSRRSEQVSLFAALLAAGVEYAVVGCVAFGSPTTEITAEEAQDLTVNLVRKAYKL